MKPSKLFVFQSPLPVREFIVERVLFSEDGGLYGEDFLYPPSGVAFRLRM